MDKFTVVLEGKLAGVENPADIADAVMEALVDSNAEDPFVFADAGVPSLRVELVVEVRTQPEAVLAGVRAANETWLRLRPGDSFSIVTERSAPWK